MRWLACRLQRTLWAELEKASKRAVTPSSVTAEVAAAVDLLPVEAISAAVEQSSMRPLLAEEPGLGESDDR